MKDKLTKKTDTNFDRICTKLRKFSVTFLCLAFISFIPLNQKLNVKSQVIETEIVALNEEKEDLLLAENVEKNDRKIRTSHMHILKH